MTALPISNVSSIQSSQNIESLTEDEFSLADDSEIPGSNKFGHSYFRDGKRQIDFVLVYTDDTKHQDARDNFQSVLRDAGLDLEVETSVRSNNRHFVKIHIPYDALMYHAEIMDLKFVYRQYIDESEISCFPVPKCMKPEEKIHFPEFNTSGMSLQHIFSWSTFLGDEIILHSDIDRIRIVWNILKKANYSRNKNGIVKLLHYGVYSAAYPLHEGEYEDDHPFGIKGRRQFLFSEWASIRFAIFKEQPLELVKSYFGEEVGFYFGWVECYTYMLLFAAVVGFIVFIIDISYEESKESVPFKEICNSGVMMCSICNDPSKCNFVPLNHSCVYAHVSYMFDSPMTVVFAIFMSVWAILFLELWKRQEAILAWKWNLTSLERVREIRPEYELKAKHVMYNPIIMRHEPSIPALEHSIRYIVSTAGVVLIIAALCSVLYAIVLYRIALSLKLDGASDKYIVDTKDLISSGTQYFMVLIVIFISESIFKKFAIILTNFEIPRTRIEYNDSYAFKIIFFKFVGYYGILTYTAFFRGAFFTHPGYDRVKDPEHNLKLDLCDPSGCLPDLFIQLAICMGVRQVILILYRNIKSIVVGFYRKYCSKQSSFTNLPRWEIDYKLKQYRRTHLFKERLEMVLQYGFVTLFAAAFPLAPVLAFIHNILQIRLHAFQMLVRSRRTIPRKVRGTGALEGILRGLTFLAIAFNAFIISLTSDFIPRLVYKMKHDGDLTGYIHDFYLSEFNTNDYGVGPLPVKTCRYIGFRLPPNSTRKYQLSTDYWYILTARLVFIIIFEHVILTLVGIISYFIPSIPSSLKQRMALERAYNLKARQEVAYAARLAAHPETLSSLDENSLI